MAALAHRAISIDPSLTGCRSPLNSPLDWRNLMTNVGMAVANICQDAGEVKWPGVESGSQGNRAADLARDGSNVVRALDSVKDPLCASLQRRPMHGQGYRHNARSNSGAPRSRSSRAMALDIADWTMWHRRRRR